MTESKKLSASTRHVGTVKASLLVIAMMAGAGLAQAADTMTTTPPTAAAKTERVVTDSWITTKVKAEILANSVSKAFKVSVKTKSGAVALRGKLPSQDSIDLVKMIAEKVDGVKSVDTSGLSISM